VIHDLQVRDDLGLGLLGLDATFFGAELQQHEVVVDLARELLDAVDLLFDLGALPKERLCLRRVFPEGGGPGAIVQLFELPTQCRDVKDAPLAS
jgi:hypothetical protein